MLQTEVTRDHEYSEKNRIQDDRQRREEILKLREEQRLSQGDQETKDEEEDDDIVIDRSKVEGKEVIVEKEATPEPQGKMGESIHQLVGTPILSRRDKSGSWINPSTPSLEAFAVGIVPFEAKEEQKPSGIFKRIMNKLRGGSKNDDSGSK
uniref:Uncharacterized protein n=1 Tax=Caenorhabditis tropicalis TaxID=1561998 RepID=A0A1I7UDB8_9PELO